MNATELLTVPCTKHSTFYADVIKGLSAPQKYLDSKYFYDATGDRLFQEIMRCEDYYPTRCEMDILSNQSAAISNVLGRHCRSFDVIELGAGDATKSIHLLQQLQQQHRDYTYYPIDISSNVIDLLEHTLPVEVPGLSIQGLNGEYMDMLLLAKDLSPKNKVVLFMGANIGNFTPDEALQFCRTLRAHLQPGDLLLTGFDLKKHPQVILNAYNDRQGITRAFNLNLLHRINRELGADFNTQQFDHYPMYDPSTGACKSYLVSKTTQQVHIAEDVVIGFRENELIYMEISQKYSLEETDHLAFASGFTPVARFFDRKKWFADCLWKA
ncbi:L-histidine N(alpha)-methyltransferase [Deminuibacter soli]|uniref:L-histidine N(Alpha)-methyltransferase n=1 Tax=Deminuibacter soli TaxID=2291815 RepID=A0A3E1NJY0_9BACT|nr:L-histidine N(alpha)-methyltransferase [Deminuibacter soli]RFM28245.1 L-histidine N(alpha)-methyltransferase [Deminuibacter soli]